jgi:hypothetical protein
METWRTIPGYSLYQISDMGRIKTFNWKNQGKIRIMKPALDGAGYLRTMLVNDQGKIEMIKVHRLVLKTFQGEPPTSQHTCNHLNSIRSDNRNINLEWATMSENMIHAFKYGQKTVEGEMNPAAILTEADVREIRKNYKYGRKSRHEGGESKVKIAERYGVSVSAIKQVINRKSWGYLQ